ncbi:hypothetical protein POPTR_009G147750v4 [Populus trichocarpa]|uniref:Uncharacterized protein n=1 Tax=Populus trichocarpa TaxID=3694 RepID=A0ACC0SIF0_POPTR|nr:hypothetical protein POPTR_009G147750v4 [Populus trichocarpa]
MVSSTSTRPTQMECECSRRSMKDAIHLSSCFVSRIPPTFAMMTRTPAQSHEDHAGTGIPGSTLLSAINQIEWTDNQHFVKPYIRRFFFSGVACTCALIPYLFSWKFSKASEIAPTCYMMFRKRNVTGRHG